MIWIAIRMLTGDRVKFIGLVFGVAFSTLLITQQLTIFVNLLLRGAAAVHEVSTANIWVMDPAGRTPDVTLPMPSTDLQRVRGVRGVAWATPMIRSGANVRTPEGDLEPVSVIGVDDSTLVGLPRTMLRGTRESLFEPDAVFIDGVGGRKLFASDEAAMNVRLELNDQRAVVRGIVDANPTFTSTVILYTRYSNALNFLPGTRNRLSFVLVRAVDGEAPATVAARIQRETGLRARTSDQFARDGIDYIIQNTGIPINFGITVALGVIVGIAIVGLTFSLFIRDNIKQFGALKAIGVTNGKIRLMVAAQSALVALIGYGLGLIMAVMFVVSGATNSDTFKGFYTPYQIPLIAAGTVVVMILLTGFLALRQVLKTEPAEVFR
ncbi:MULTISPECIES: ABC transporter permease [unclassified Sphingomonas]|uniref:ABC transporter permease n=2 Tax=unclassified Sphingomonas TaxID=196159 RepID=UPI000832D1D5|nr:MULTISPECIES: ABC transporter permease [unclassified Sphingomonas]MCH4892084.1 FtsX-like permease family protein [Sphingomonas sp. SFZ2018-12]